MSVRPSLFQRILNPGNSTIAGVIRRRTPRLGAMLLVVLLLCGGEASCAAPQLDLSQYFGFEPLEIFKLEHRSASLRAGDLNHDGLTDLVLIDNSHSRIDLLQQRGAKPDTVESGQQVNEISYDWRFEHRKIAIDKQAASMTLGDFDADGRTDIAYFGLPDQLVIRYQPESGEWSRRARFRLPDVQPAAWILTAGDVNHDERSDIIVVGKGVTYVLYQGPAERMAAPVRLMNTSSKLGMARIADLDGDGRNDFSYVASEQDESSQFFCARLQSKSGRLGPELRFEIKQPRAVTLADVDRKDGHEVLTVEARTGRVNVLQFQRPQSEAGRLARQLTQFGLGPEGDSRESDLALGDLDGDGLLDVLVSDPESASVIVFRQQKDAGLDLGQTFPALVGTKAIRTGDFDKNGSAEVVVLSDREKTIGICRMQEGRLTFPQPLKIVGEPQVLDLADLDRDGTPEIVYVSRQRDGRRSNYSLRALRRSSDGNWAELLLGKEAALSLELGGTPGRLMALDANADERIDLLILSESERAPQLLVGTQDGSFSEVTTGGGIQLGEVEPGAVFAGDVDGAALLVAQGKFARNLRLSETNAWQVLDQYNAAESAAQVAGVATLNLDGNPGNEIVLVDTGVGKLRILRRDGSLYQPWQEVDTGKLRFRSTHVGDLDGDGNDDLLLLGAGRFSVLYAGKSAPTLREIASFETKLSNAFLSDVIAGDVNSDRYVDLVAFDSKSHFVEVLDLDPKLGLRHALHFKLFEEKSFGRNAAAAGIEPRESLIVDVTNDGKPDLVVLTHDRVLVYPQD